MPQRRWRDAIARKELAVELGAQYRYVVDAAEVRAAIAAERREVRDIIIQRIEVDIPKKLLLPDMPAAVLADLALTVKQGMSDMARDGADRGRLLATAEAATSLWSLYEV